MPDLDFRVVGARAEAHATAPTVLFALELETGAGTAIRSLTLDIQLRLAALRRGYDDAERERLGEIFGASHRWGDTLRNLFWTSESLTVPPFTGETSVELPVACTYDFEVATAQYFHALGDGEVPVEFLFSGTVFHRTPEGALRAARIPWEKEARLAMPVRVWREAMDASFPNAAWIRLRRDIFDRLRDFRAGAAIPRWDETVEELLDRAGVTPGDRSGDPDGDSSGTAAAED